MPRRRCVRRGTAPQSVKHLHLHRSSGAKGVPDDRCSIPEAKVRPFDLCRWQSTAHQVVAEEIGRDRVAKGLDDRRASESGLQAGWS